jgi:Flp pilus assembly protein TadD
MFSGDVLIAASTLEQLLERHPDYPPAMGRLAAAYILSGRKEEGLRFIEKLISKGFDGARVLEEQARAFMAESKFEAAVCILTSAVEKGIDNGSMNDLLAVCRSKIDGSAPICNPADYSSYLQRQPSELHGNSAAL